MPPVRPPLFAIFLTNPELKNFQSAAASNRDSRMNLKQIAETLDAAVLYAPDGWEDVAVENVFASDLISDILVSEGDEPLLLTSLTSPQVVRTATLIGAAAMVLVHRRQTPASMEAAARQHDLPLFRSAVTKFEACVRLGKLLEAS